MSIDKLQEKIRKTKNPIVLDLTLLPEQIPECITAATNCFSEACEQYCTELLYAFKDSVPAVRFHLGALAIVGTEGMSVLQNLLKTARKCGFYIFLDGFEPLSAQSASYSAQILFSDDCKFIFDGLIITSFIGSDSIEPYTQMITSTGKDLFVVARTSNRSASEMQDLLSGSRLAHMAKVDIVNRFSQSYIGRSGFSNVAIMAAASSADSLRIMRAKYKHLFMLLDGCDYPNANMKNCSYAFDQFGHGAIACVSNSVTAAWQSEEETDYIVAAKNAINRLKKNIGRYITIL